MALATALAEFNVVRSGPPSKLVIAVELRPKPCSEVVDFEKVGE